MNKRNLFLKILAIIFIIIGIIIFLFPYISNYIYEKNVEENKKEFIIQIQNKQLYENEQKDLIDPFSYEQPSIDLSKYGIQDNIIGYIQIPKMNIELPILLGANSANMKKGATHLTQTSYPIGGLNTNSVIAAHRGYSKAELFRHIEKLEQGDRIYIQNFKEQIVYEVFKIKLVEPDDISELRISEGEDIITLITCHPYRVNTHRYIVKARRQI